MNMFIKNLLYLKIVVYVKLDSIFTCIDCKIFLGLLLLHCPKACEGAYQSYGNDAHKITNVSVWSQSLFRSIYYCYWDKCKFMIFKIFIKFSWNLEIPEKEFRKTKFGAWTKNVIYIYLQKNKQTYLRESTVIRISLPLQIPNSIFHFNNTTQFKYYPPYVLY